jgi:nucleoside-diphosphate-sugar epimerase
VARILVAGAGDVGSAFGSIRAARGDEVFGLRRDVSRVAEGIVPVGADLTRPETLRDLPGDLDALVFAAAADRTDEPAYRAVYVEGLRNVLAAVAPVGRVLFVSSTAVYAQSAGEWVDEHSPTEPTRFSGTVMLEAESIARESAAVACALRLGGIYGPGRLRLVEQVRRGDAACTEGVFTNRIHRDDAAAALSFALDLDAPPGILNVVDDDPAPRCEVLSWLADRMGAPPPSREDEPRARSDNKRVANARLRALGWSPTYPSYRDGYAALLAPG